MGSKSQTRSHATPAAIGDISHKNLEACIGMQKGMLDALGEFNHDWSERAAAEVQLVSNLANNLAAARSVPEAAAAYQEWMSRRMEMLAEDGRRLLSGRTRDG